MAAFRRVFVCLFFVILGSSCGVISGPASPAQNPTATAAAAVGMTVTLADNGTTVMLPTGGSFLLQLGSDLDWNVVVADPGIVSRDVNILVIRGAQGVYQAQQAGTTTLAATGTPICRTTAEPCPQYVVNFMITVIVTG
jgi:hypothetical protein